MNIKISYLLSYHHQRIIDDWMYLLTNYYLYVYLKIYIHKHILKYLIIKYKIINKKLNNF